MDNHITDIDQHPVAGRKTFDTGLTETAFFQCAQHVVSQGPYVTMGTTRSDNQGVCDRAFAAQIDTYDILRLIILKAVENQGLNGQTVLGDGGTLVNIGRRRFGGR